MARRSMENVERWHGKVMKRDVLQRFGFAAYGMAKAQRSIASQRRGGVWQRQLSLAAARLREAQFGQGEAW